MKDIVIISAYDNGCNFNVMVNGIVSSPFDSEEKTIADDLYAIYMDFDWESGKEFKKLFPEKTVIFCNNGGIEVL